MNLNENPVTKLSNEYDNFPVWSPHTNLITFIRRIDGDFEVMTIHRDGTGLAQLTHARGNEAHLAWSPDGDRYSSPARASDSRTKSMRDRNNV